MKLGLQTLLTLQDKDNDTARAKWEWQGWQGGARGAGATILSMRPPREPQKSTRRPGGQGDSPGPPLRSTVLPPGRPHAPTPGTALCTSAGCPPRTGPSPRPPRLSLPRARAPGISQALEGTPALEASPQRQHTWCVSHSTRSSSSSHVLT